MKFQSTRRLLVAALLGTLAFATVPASAQQPIVIKFSHVVAKDTPKGLAADYFAKLVAEKTGGKVKVEVYPNSQLYKDGEEMEALQLGSVQMLAPSLAKFGPLGVPDFEAFDLPFIFDNYEELHKITYGPIGSALFKKLEPKGIVGLAYWDNGFKDFSANKQLRVPADFKGLKMRIQSSKVLDSEMRALGVNPQVMAFSEVYQALSTGVVDGTENPPSNFYTQKMHEVQKFMLRSQHGYLGYAVIVNKRFWDGLPGDIRKTLGECMVEATTYANKIALQKNDEDVEAVKKSAKTTIIVPNAAERLEMKKALAPVHKQHAARIGNDLLQAIYKETGFDPDKL
ncbi:TRAP transporter substrate-binding protein [Uliginosibacterium sp. H3]|uniref:TRAP transporter substrate-binding protein n=1 Tax=Uliginosibacterium silvisoli TaxID=3114758 RepID=A0ABU6JZ88_9RHOO|nr:TRAP transporter substrate-binding protein [Uliginosibacterium sp. H3]